MQPRGCIESEANSKGSKKKKVHALADTSSDNAPVANVVTYINGTLPGTTDNSTSAGLNEDKQMYILMVE
jgi:hypothetical protein